MKKTTFILIGIILGSGVTITTQELIKRSRPSYARVREMNDELWGAKFKDRSIKDFEIIYHDGYLTKWKGPIEPDGGTLFIGTSHKNIYVQLEIHGDRIYSVHASDKSHTTSLLCDENLDGIWDYRDFDYHDEISGQYKKGSVYPDTVFGESNTMVRIDNKYYVLQEKDGQYFYMHDGIQIELEMEDRKGYFLKTKESEPVE